MSNLSRTKAEQALAAVKARYHVWFEPIHSVDDPTKVISEPGPEPVLQGPGVQCSGWAIVWEEGPDDWPTQVSMGGSTEEHRTLMAAASQEFGTTLAVEEPPPVTFPAGIYAEPVNHVCLGLYPA